ncbi:Protein involved in biosynthesis of mitomycin antibiotics/polyketide fumonisin [Candidatus Pelagibacter ubique]|uniref:Protein involved in biosynthesis of mitomycin antibiotics/polyketide fumonisin n=1 Tax=Pelagibacter ubique TaxID=198252 RepID=A0ABX1SZ41_PELUQ|nr:phytanoyl-CoA dioxygenase family protein [Candidatus Pelagibacter ubique]NMN67102.1 Protein involved in biosynthesis of mitomycin antibiotics/polyketide fumonisin [Candidatus Pelagibacter ubique]
MKKIETLVKNIVKKLHRDGFCIVNNFIKEKECESLIHKLEKLNNSLSKNKKFVDENSKNGQLIIRDLPLRDPKTYLKLLDKKLILNVLKNIFKETFILDNCQASGSINVRSNYKTLVHIDSHLPCKFPENTSDVVICYCLNDFTKENGATKIWPKSHLSTTKIQNNKKYKKEIKKKFVHGEAKKGSIIFFLGQTWHQIGKNTNSKKRWGILCHYKRWWIKPSTDWAKCGPKIFGLLNDQQKELFGFTSISPKFNLKTRTRTLKTLRKSFQLNKNYFKTIQY